MIENTKKTKRGGLSLTEALAGAFLMLSSTAFLPIDSFTFVLPRMSVLVLGVGALSVIGLWACRRRGATDIPTFATPIVAATLLYLFALLFSSLAAGRGLGWNFDLLDARSFLGTLTIVLFAYLVVFLVRRQTLPLLLLGISTLSATVAILWWALFSGTLAATVIPFSDGFAQQAVVSLGLLLASILVLSDVSSRVRWAAAAGLVLLLPMALLTLAPMVWLVVSLLFVLALTYQMRKNDALIRKTKAQYMTAGVAGLALLIALFFPSRSALQAPVLAPSQAQSLSVARYAIAESPLFGVGPRGFINAYAQSVSPLENQGPRWSVRYFSAASRLTTIATETGLSGIAAFLFLLSAGSIAAVRVVARKREGSDTATLLLASSWLLMALLYIVMPGSLVHDVLFWTLTAALATHPVLSTETSKLNRAFTAAFSRSFVRTAALAASLLVLGGGVVLVGMRANAAVSFERGRDITTDVDGLTQEQAAAVRSEDAERRLMHFRAAADANPGSSRIWRARANTASYLATEASLRIGEEADAVAVLTYATEAAEAANRAAETQLGQAAGESFRAEILGQLAKLGAPDTIDAALQAREAATRLDPTNPVYHTDLALLRMEIGNDFAILATRDLTDSIEPTEEQRALAEQAQELFVAAEQAFNTAIAVKGDYAPAYSGLAQLALIFNDVEAALQAQQQAVVYAPENTRYRLNFAELLASTGERDRAVTVLQDLLALDPTHAAAQRLLESLTGQEGTDGDPTAAEAAE